MPKKLLVADDSVTIQKVVGLTFAGEDVVIESVANGDLAIEKVREFMPDIVLADVFMPGRNGYEVCATIKEDPELSKIPVVLLVGTFEPFDEVEASRVKCDAYLTKPFDTSELLQVVRSLAGDEPTKRIPDESEQAGNFAEEVRGQEIATDRIPEWFQPPPPLPLVSDRTRESFLGANRVLDLFDPSGRAHAQVRSKQNSFQFLDELLVDCRAGGENRFDAAYEVALRGPESLLHPLEQACLLLGSQFRRFLEEHPLTFPFKRDER